MKKAARGFTRISMFGEELPTLENRIELASDKDAFGMPPGRLIHTYDEDAVALWRANREEGQKAAANISVGAGNHRNVRYSQLATKGLRQRSKSRRADFVAKVIEAAVEQ